MVELPNEFRPKLETYRGPLDLLLYLIKKDEIDILDIPIARIVEQYRAYLEILKIVDPNSCGEFLVMAANLMEIKSKSLLPSEELEADEELEDPRLELVTQLLEYKKYKERALLLESRFAEFQRRHDRPAIAFSDGDFDEPDPTDLGDVSVWDLLTAFHRIQIALGNRGPVRFVVQDRPIHEYVEQVSEILSELPNRSARFDDLFAESVSRQDAIGILLAILEMAKEHRIIMSQEDPFGPIDVTLRPEDELRRLQEEDARAAADDREPAEAFLLEGEGQEAVEEPMDVALKAAGESETLTPDADDAPASGAAEAHADNTDDRNPDSKRTS